MTWIILYLIVGFVCIIIFRFKEDETLPMGAWLFLALGWLPILIVYLIVKFLSTEI
jgi:hypothetical protein